MLSARASKIILQRYFQKIWKINVTKYFYLREICVYIFTNKESIVNNECIHYYKTRKRENIHLPSAKYKATFNSPNSIDPSLYNNLPD